MAASAGKRCLYEILGISRDCSPEEIRSAYRKLALQRHPDKLVSQAGISEKEANAAFQELVNAYEVLSDPKERSWYDSHRNKILFSEPGKGSSSSSAQSVPDLFPYYSNSCYSGFGHTGKGFFKVYGDLFDKIYEQEVSTAKKLGLGLEAVREAPLMGNLNCDYTQVTAFYNYWSGFSSIMEFWWADEQDVEMGYDRKSRRQAEEHNKKCRKKAKKEFNEMVRGLAEFVKKRDKRVVEMKIKKMQEMEKKKEELKEKKKEMQRQKLERARLYEEPDWAKVDEEEIGLGFEEVDNNKKKDEINELHCIICNKKFKSDKQWKNHEQSKKHKEKVAMFREEMGSDGSEEEEVNEDMGPSVLGNDAVVDDLSEKFEDAFEFQEEQSKEVKQPSTEEEEGEKEDEEEEEEEIDAFDVNHDNEAGNSGSDEESILLRAMLSGQKNRKKAASKRETEMPSSNETPDTTDDGVTESMVYDTMKKSARGNRRAKKGSGKKSNTEEVSSDSHIKHGAVDEGNEPDNSNTLGSSSDTINEVGQKSSADPPPLGKNVKGHKKARAEDMVSNSKKASKGRKQKGASKSTDHLCDTCGQDFESRNKLHRHLGDTGHASLKSR